VHYRRLALIAATASLVTCGPAAAQDAPNFAGEVLAAHNEARADMGVPPLKWNEKLAADAAAWAQRLSGHAMLRHSGVSDQGENLWLGTRDYFDAATMVSHWVEEKAQYHAGRFPDNSTTGNWADVGHYTQIVWRTTREVGCARASDATLDYLVCRYSPPGNWLGEDPVGPAGRRMAGTAGR
jgi:uncharacterized protein YkwD